MPLEIGGQNPNTVGPYPKGASVGSGIPVTTPPYSPGSVGIILSSVFTQATLPSVLNYPTGTIAYTTDQGWFYNNGTSWTAFGSGGGSSGTIPPFIVVSGNTTLNATNPSVEVNAASGPITIQLPTAIGATGFYNVKKIDSSSNAVTILPFGSQTIDGQTSIVIQYQYSNVSMQPDGSNFVIT